MLELLEFEFMRRALIAGLAIGVVAPVIGVFLVVRRYSLLADTLAHVSLAGVAVALLTRTSPMLNAVAISVVAGVLIERMRGMRRMLGESAVGLFLWSGLALAVVLISIADGFNADLFSVLFGSILTVTAFDLKVIVPSAALVLVLLLASWRRLFSVSFDEELAQASGINAEAYNLITVIAAAVTIALSIRVVGVLLIGALMVVPVLSAMQLGRSFKQTVALSVIISLISVSGGLVLSYYFGLASGGTIVLCAVGLFIVSLMISHVRRNAT